jgi:hypothetical protein
MMFKNIDRIEAEREHLRIMNELRSNGDESMIRDMLTGLRERVGTVVEYEGGPSATREELDRAGMVALKAMAF